MPSLTFISLVIYITHSCTVSVFNSVIVKILKYSYHSLSSVFPQKLTNLTVISFKSSSTQAAVCLVCKTGLTGCIIFATVIDTFVLEKKRKVIENAFFNRRLVTLIGRARARLLSGKSRIQTPARTTTQGH